MILLGILAAAAMSPGDGKTMALDDWHPIAIYGVGAVDQGPLYLQVHAGDLDGDGRADDAILKLLCADGRVQQALLRPRDVTRVGAPTEKRNDPVTGWVSAELACHTTTYVPLASPGRSGTRSESDVPSTART